MKPISILFLLACCVATASASAQTDISTVGQIEKLESDLTIKRLNDELLKPAGGGAGAVAPAQGGNLQAAPQLSSQPVVHERPYVSPVYGMTGHDGAMEYHGVLFVNGTSYPISQGTRVAGYRVAKLTKTGAELVSEARGSKGARVWAPTRM
ncbi:hypothetical protein [Ralstonia thomasii]|uniref:Type IV pilus biogenesis protein PilP n=1 Tax=Ralstonia thomasii TaxID=3058596 RepID=A0ABM9JWV6_9RALS|nr:hypothetical protein [Ralstonia sp. LMG 18095]CAJ0807021.1 hypothetical protein LMG18095_04538 [Ralstonia sp. LMG 18095]